MEDFMLGLGIVSIIALIVSFFMEEPISMNRIHKNLAELDVKPLKKGAKSTYKLTITDHKGHKITYPLDQDSFFFTICHFSPNCEAFVNYMLELWCLSPFNLILTPHIGESKNSETLGLWQWNGKQHTISVCTHDMEKEVMALVLIHEIAHLRIHTLTSYAYVYNLAGKKIKSPYYGMSVKPHGPQFAAVFAEISRPTLEMDKLYTNKQRRHLTTYFQSPKKVHLTPLTKCGKIPVY
jgi:hypothetical protein